MSMVDHDGAGEDPSLSNFSFPGKWRKQKRQRIKEKVVLVEGNRVGILLLALLYAAGIFMLGLKSLRVAEPRARQAYGRSLPGMPILYLINFDYILH